MARSKQGRRSKPKKKPSRYNPNAPDWREVHGGWWQRGVASVLRRPIALPAFDPGRVG